MNLFDFLFFIAIVMGIIAFFNTSEESGVGIAIVNMLLTTLCVLSVVALPFAIIPFITKTKRQPKRKKGSYHRNHSVYIRKRQRIRGIRQ